MPRLSRPIADGLIDRAINCGNHRTAVLERFEGEKLIERRAGLRTITNLGAILFAKKLDEFDRLARKASRLLVQPLERGLNLRR